jgi:hypothetical protein
MAEYSESYINGWNAHRLGVDVKKNPYDPNSQRWSNSQWNAGWHSRSTAPRFSFADESVEAIETMAIDS